ncbi:MAG: hypothetical protein QM642_10210 [Edaphocola sp.]
MKPKIKTAIIAIAAPVILVVACTKYKDPDASTGIEGLTNYYCNDSRAVNYNWGFPGIANDSVCVYPVDSFVGTWVLADTVTLDGSDTFEVVSRTLTITATEDSTLTHLAIDGWCGSSYPFYALANKYSKAVTDTLANGADVQYLCSTNDTIVGTLNKNTGVGTQMKMDFTVNGTSGISYHSGTATKQ